MGIELYGPEGYDYQYRVTIFVALVTAAKIPLRKVIVEPAGGEDALVECQPGAESLTIEVQVKREDGGAGIAELGQVLAHFPSRCSTDCLADRLIADVHRRLIWVTRSRANDDTRGLLAPSRQSAPHAQIPLRGDQVPKLVAAMEAAWTEKKKLAQARRNHCAGFTARSAELAGALKRVSIWELHDDAAVRAAIRDLLIQPPFGIPLADVDQALADMTEAVRRARLTRADAFPALQGVLAKFAQRPMRRVEYWHPRPDEAGLEAQLRREHSLALTGHSKSGKTALACEFLGRLRTTGWRCEVTADPAAAERFLHSDDLQERACLLDDPFEGVHAEALGWRTNKVRSLGELCCPGRLLLVTSRQDTLQRLLKSQPSPLVFAGFTWQDVTIRDAAFAMQLWQELAARKRVAAAVIGMVAAELQRMKPETLLQTGQLDQLARRPDLAGKNRNQLLRFARYNAEELAVELRQRPPEVRRVMAALGLCATALEGVAVADLAFVLSDSSTRPSWKEGGIREYGGQPKPGRFPNYETTFRLTPKASHALREFEDRGYLSRAGERLRFTHPDYAESFAQVFATEQQSTNDMTKRALSCLDAVAGIAAVRALERIWDGAGEADKPALCQLAVTVVNDTIFPSVQEAAIGSLLHRASALSTRQLQDVWSALSWNRNPNSTLAWAGDTPWFDRNPRSLVGLMGDRSHRRLPARRIRAIRMRLGAAAGNLVSAREADAVIAQLRDSTLTGADAGILQTIARFDDAFLRSDALSLLCGGELHFTAATAALMDDSDPRVTARAIQKCLESWAVHDSHGTLPEVRKAVVACLQRSPVAVLVARFLFDFGDYYSEFAHIPWTTFTAEQKKQLWEFWCECMTVVLRVLGPHRIHFKDGDLFDSLQQVGAYGTREGLVGLFAAWADWIDAQSKLVGLSDYSLAIAGTALQCAALLPGDRETMLRRWLRFRCTDALLECTKDIVDLWPTLSAAEKDMFRQFVCDTKRRDRRWILAALLLRGCPRDLLTAVVAREDFYRLIVAQVRTVLGPGLTEAIHALYCQETPAQGAHPPRAHPRFWEEFWWVMVLDSRQAEHRLARWRLLEYLGMDLAKGARRGRFVQAFTRLCNRADATARRQLFDDLLAASTSMTEPHLRECWSAHYAVCTAKERSAFARILAKYAEPLSTAQKTLRFLGKEWFELFVHELPIDRVLLTLMSAGRKAGIPPAESFEPVAKFYEVATPRLLMTHDWALALYRSGNCTDPVAKQRIETARDKTFAASGNARGTLRRRWLRKTNWIW